MQYNNKFNLIPWIWTKKQELHDQAKMSYALI